MKYEEYSRLYNGLNGMEDIRHFEEEGYDRRLLETLYTQKVNRAVKRRFRAVKSGAPKMLRAWENGETMCQIAKRYRFPPMLIAMMIFQEDGCGRKAFWEYVRNPDLLDSPETAAELREAAENDIAYSPEANERSRERGEWGEGLLWGWLNGQDVTYQTEADERSDENHSGKTPDCLLDEPMMFEGQEIRWIESKASFGDKTEFDFNSKKQLIPYTELFGQGVVVYWTGHLDDLECPSGVIVEDSGILKKKLEKLKKI